MKIAIITACPAGVATSFMAARRLEEKAKKQGIETLVECHSNVEPVQLLTAEQLAQCDKVILAVPQNHNVDLSRLNGLNVVLSSIDTILADPQAVLDSDAKSFEAPQQVAPAQSSDHLNVVAVTACPTGVAHTFMAAEALEQAGQRRGWTIKVETRGSVGAKNQLTDDEIANADLVILATDIEVDRSPFAGKKVYHCSTGSALKKTQQVLDDAVANATVQSGSSSGAATSGGSGKKEKSGPYKHLLTGVSFMLPMVVAGGLLIAISFIFGIHAFEQKGTLAAALMDIGGGTAFKLMIPVLAGYIAYSIADRPGLTPGMIGGLLASTLGAGFIGGIIAGFLAGYTAKFFATAIKLPESVESLKPILIIPLLASAVTGLVMIYVVGKPTAALMESMTHFLKNMGSANAILLGIVVGLMMCFDLGGPINKAAYTFGVGLLASQTYAPMAAIMASGMVPPLGMAIATVIARRKFSKAETEAGKAAFVLGLCFITEGSIPFAARDPLRVIPANMIGGAITGALSMYFGCKLMAPHGGIFVLAIPHAINHVLLYLISIVVGAAVTGIIYAFFRKPDTTSIAKPASGSII
ncbi:PTS fructose-like transporter subunit IIB [Celerinatantimonas diazotrophica]|uniref:protein-N(pi)-phosphohistidine--D-fructose phosphotransferase n=1 Tax=Celerinatantimonas diazotrophica TaxID=412034 RepID=A0A4R1KDR8_9GAMM|nr:PTS fructose-like transporter subunit IIB [Celerinatantimonas diazotrophica]TCK62766.1 PTS system D-fructose-specific IIB component (F1P-forming) (Frc family) /PTS system D-fructose-specific IIC component (F1P-forming) (Frc family) [Celerinatantimonas diazotrophica]CAG9298396.1 PTS system fructose-specific EIIB'BC component [Celerinatantimonas diazotrophica]